MQDAAGTTPITNTPTPPRTILVVEDDAETGITLKTLLRHYHYQVLHARSVADGITQANREPDVILLDLMLPDGDGEQVLQHVRRRHLRSRVIVISAIHDMPRLRAVAQLKPDGIQLKPLNFFELLDHIRPATAAVNVPRQTKVG